MELHVKYGHCDDALSAAGRLPLEAEQKELLATAVRGACRAVAGDWTAALGYLQGLIRHTTAMLDDDRQSQRGEMLGKKLFRFHGASIAIFSYTVKRCLNS